MTIQQKLNHENVAIWYIPNSFMKKYNNKNSFKREITKINNKPEAHKIIQNNHNVSTINQVMTGYIQLLEKEPLTQALINDFQKLSKKEQLKVLAYIQELSDSSGYQ